jgi:PhzF family phenazine biosynthesis protein
MRKLKFKKIDAFASKSSAGNPAAAVYLNSANDLSSAEMLQVAKELKGFVSEVGYVVPGTGDTDYQLRYFSAAREVAFCGHATIAILNDIVATNETMQKKTTLSIATNTDKLVVENRYQSEQSVYISAPTARFSKKDIFTADIVSALNCHTHDINTLLPAQIVNAGLETLVVPITGIDSILSVSPDLDVLNEFCDQIAVDIIILYSPETVDPDAKYRTRVFAPTFGYLEDPATGSGNAALGYYLLKHNLWDGDTIKIEQNNFRDSPNYVQLFSKSNQVWFGGGAVLKINGEYILS